MKSSEDKSSSKGPKRKRVVTSKHSGGACHTCRQRKVKCDESRPFCQRCTLAGRQCLGYRSAVLSLPGNVNSQTLVPVDSAPIPLHLKQSGPFVQDEDYAFIKREDDTAQSPGLWQAALAELYTRSNEPVSTIPLIDTRPLEQLQMLSLVLGDHLPREALESTFAKKSSYLCRLPAMDLSSSLVSNAVDSLCLAHFGSRNNNESHLVASRVFYGNALSALSRVIQSGKEHGHSPRMIIASIMMISLYDESLPLKHRQNNDWETHYWGVHEFLKRFGTGALDFRNEFDLRLYQNLRMPLYFLALVRRKRLVFAQPDWRHATDFSQSARIYTRVSKDWYAMAAPLPGLLEEADALVRSTGLERPSSAVSGQIALVIKSEQLTDVFHGIEMLKRELLSWLIEENKASGRQIITVADPVAFDSAIEEHAFIISSEVFREFIYYKDATMIVRAVAIYLSCLIADCTLLRLLLVSQHSESGLPTPGTDKTFLESSAFRLAKDLCMAVYGYSKLSSISHAHFLHTLLSVARAFFLEYGALDEMEWAWNCMAATQSRIRRIKITEPPTLCRIASLGTQLEALLESVRYKSFGNG